MSEVRSAPCAACPYRKDVPSGVWAPEEYDKLPPYDAPTADQPMETFGCHATPEHYCHGWAVVHTSRGHAYDLLALRLAEAMGHDVSVPEPAVELFASGSAAAIHGQYDIENPSEEAWEAMERLARKYTRLRSRRP